MKISHIEHLGIAVKSIEEALPYYENVLGLKCYNIETVEDQKVKTAFLKCGETKIELLEPTGPDSTIAKFIENRGMGVHHVAFAIEDGVANALAEADAKGKQLTRFKYTRQEVIAGKLLNNKLAKPLIWLTEDALHDVLLQGTGVMNVELSRVLAVR